MAALTPSMDITPQNLSPNHQDYKHSSGGTLELTYPNRKNPSGADSMENFDVLNDSHLDFQSEIPLPNFWEQCLDLEMGEAKWINWITKENARNDQKKISEDLYSKDDFCSWDNKGLYDSYTISEGKKNGGRDWDGQVLVVVGCKSCLMYFMVPEHQNDCPMCCDHLLQFYPSVA